MLALMDGLFFWVRSRGFCYRLTLFTRILLAAGSIPTGMVKLLGQRFASIPLSEPVGFFFEALYRTGEYWRFLGACQVVAGMLLLWPVTAHLGAALFVPIIANIFVITVSMEFGGTPAVTGSMLAAVVYLCLWDFHRFRAMVASEPFARPLPVQRLDVWETACFTVFAMALIGFFGATRGFVAAEFMPALIAAGLASGSFALIRFLWISARKVPLLHLPALAERPRKTNGHS